MSRRKYCLLSSLAVGLVLSLVAVGCAQKPVAPSASPTPQPVAPSPSAAPKAVYSWTIASSYAPTNYVSQGYTRAAKELEAQSGGRISIRVATVEELGYKGPDILGLVGRGTLKIGDLYNWFHLEIGPWGASYLPFISASIDDTIKVKSALRPLEEKVLADDYGIKLIDTYANPAMEFFTNQPISSLEALKGLKIRSPNAAGDEVIKLLQGVPVSIAFAELYTAIQRGIVDGVVTAPVFAVDVKVWEVVKYVNMLGWSIPHLTIGMNLDTFKALPPDLQELVVKAFGKMCDELTDESRRSGEKNVKILTEKGMSIYTVPKDVRGQLVKAGQPIWDKWVKESRPEAAESLRLAKKALGIE